MKTRKILSLILALCLCLGLLPMTALAAGDFSITDGVLTKYTGPGGDVVIPQGVVAIGDRVFYGNSNLTSVTIPSSVTTIGAEAFYGCSGLTGVTIPQGVTTIGDYAFQDCDGLTSITIPEGVTTIGGWAFSSCSSLTSATIPGSVTTLEDRMFFECGRLTSVTISEGVTTIGDSAFQSCDGLTSVTIPEGVTTIGHWAFSGCISLPSITIPDSVTEIGEGAFSSCFFLTSITIPPEVAYLNSVQISPEGTVYGAPGSYAELWAQDNGYKFEADRPFTTTPSRTAYASTQSVNVDGTPVEFQMYALKDENGNLTNYIKLRDLAYALNGSASQFQVGYADGQVSATKQTVYTPNGSEMSTPFSGNRTYLDTYGGIMVNGIFQNANGFVLRDDNGGGYTYYQLRDLGKLLFFNVGWSADKGVYVETGRVYDYDN